MDAAITRSDLAEMAAACDLDGVGAAPARPVPVDAGVAARLAARMPPELGYFARSLDRRLDPSLVLPGVRSVIAGFVAYAGASAGLEAMPPGGACVSRFAWCRDYHDTVGARFARLAASIEARGGRGRWHVDTGPVLEKAWAAAAGLGFVGRNTLLVTPRFGSFVFLGVVLTDLDVEPSAPVPDGCGSCSACRDACPTGALGEERVLDASRCLAHLTVTARGPFPAELASSLRGHLYGCDVCQDACPWNRRAERPDRPEFRPLAGLHYPAAAEVATMDDEAFDRLFGPTPARRRGADGVREIARMLTRV